MLSDQRHILARDIPLEVAALFAIVAAIAIGFIVWGYRTGGRRGENILRATSVALCILGLCVAGYIAYTALIVKGSFQCLGGGGGCALVEQSEYARFLGIHMSIWGLVGYATILGATIWKGDNARLAVFMLTLFGFIVSLILRYLELWEIHASCQWCVSSAVLMTLLLIASTCRLVGYYGTDADGLDEPEEADQVQAREPEPETT